MSLCAKLKWDNCPQIHVELALLRGRWHIILAGLMFQYVHGIFTQLAYRMHTPAATPLHDVGFELLPELPPDLRWVSEAIFAVAFVSFIAWSFTPLLWQRGLSTVVLWTRMLTVLVVCQVLRILSFSSTQLPGPALHCRRAASTATRPWPSHWWQHLVVDVGRQVAHSCGDLIFSSHMTFILTGVLAYNHYGSKVAVKAASWAIAAALALLIIAARKHYTVDVVIAWYVVPLVYTLLHVSWAQQNSQAINERSSSSGGRLLQEKVQGVATGEVLAFVGVSDGAPCWCCSCGCRVGSSSSSGRKGGAAGTLPCSSSSSCGGLPSSSPAAAAELAEARMSRRPMWWLAGRQPQRASGGCCWWCQQSRQLLCADDIEAQPLVIELA